METGNDYANLLRLIRDEFELANKPLRDDLHEIKEDVRELKGSTYTKEQIDLMFRLRDERLSRIQQLGGILVGAAYFLWCVLACLQIMHVIP